MLEPPLNHHLRPPKIPRLAKREPILDCGVSAVAACSLFTDASAADMLANMESEMELSESLTDCVVEMES
ncbi:MAG: hypothetical protein LBH13_04710 [Cellulomonadaceae bacterium]|jgi:hypothetical protein|nr:hypothetical protein [Cellulomonadaceae bacterium]